MGAKVQLSFLVDMEPKIILQNSMLILYQMGWRYNQFQLGEYNYWLSGPIYEFGDSITIVEDKMYEELNKKAIELIIDKISLNYSPSILLGLKYKDRVIEGRFSIFEIENSTLKEIIFTVENISDNIWKDLLVTLFTCLATELNCVFGLGGIELGDILQTMKYVENTNNLSGDIYCLPKSFIKGEMNNNLSLTFHVNEIKSNYILVRKENLLDLK